MASSERGFSRIGRTGEPHLTHLIATIGRLVCAGCSGLAVREGAVLSCPERARPGIGRIGVIVALRPRASADQLAAAAKQLAMHIAQQPRLSQHRLGTAIFFRARPFSSFCFCSGERAGGGVCAEQARKAESRMRSSRRWLMGGCASFTRKSFCSSKSLSRPENQDLRLSSSQAGKSIWGKPIRVSRLRALCPGEGIDRIVRFCGGGGRSAQERGASIDLRMQAFARAVSEGRR